MEKDKNQISSPPLRKELNLDKYYKSANSPSVRSLNFGLWVATKRHLFINAIVVTLIVIIAGFFIYSAYQYTVYFIDGQRNDAKLAATNNNQVVSSKNLYANLIVAPLQVIAGSDSYDLALKIKNPNDKFMARFSYCFSEAGAVKICQNGFIFPNEEKYFLALGQKFSSTSNISYELQGLSWQRINTHTYPDWSNYYLTHTNFLASNIKFNQSESLGADVNNLEFTLSNKTPYNFWDIPLNILIFSGEKLVGINIYSAKELLSQENRQVKLNWQGRISQSSAVQIMPNLDIVASDIYIKNR